MQKNIITLVVALVLIAGLFWGVSHFKSNQTEEKNSYQNYYTQKAIQKKEAQEKNNSQKSANQEVILYFGKECPHCHEVIDYLKEHKVSEKIKYSQKEVWHNKDNQKEMMKKVNECGLDPQKVGVPFLYAKGKCYIGTPDVLEYFKNNQ